MSTWPGRSVQRLSPVYFNFFVNPYNFVRALGRALWEIMVELGEGCSQHAIGARVGVGWIHSSDGSDVENISTAFRATGRDADGGYAEYMVVPERYAYPIPDTFSERHPPSA